MDEPKEEKSTYHGRKLLNPFAVNRPKKRSLVERELETNMTARITSPVTVADGGNTSRYGRARRIKTGFENRMNVVETLKSPKSENTPVKVESPITKKMLNSPYKMETPKKALKASLDNIDNIFQDIKSPNCFNLEPTQSPSAKKFSKVYIRKDLIQNRDDDDDDDIIMIKDLFSSKSGKKQRKAQSSSEKCNIGFNKQNGHIENASVVKALDFDGNKVTVNKVNGNKRDSDKESSQNKRMKTIDPESVFKAMLAKVEESCPYQAGDMAWARMGTFPFWPCIITRDPESEMFVRKKLFGRVEHYILHVTFFADNGRRSWVVDNMLRKYLGLEEFVSTREKFTTENKKNNPRLYSAFFISEKKQSLWNTSVAEAEMISRAPKTQRIDLFNELLYTARASKKQLKSGKVTRTDSDVSLSESLYDSLFSEEDVKVDDSIRSQNRTRNRSLDVSDVVTACLDNMAAKTGNIKIQKQSHMDRWLQKAKSKTPEKVKTGTEQVLPKTPVITPKIESVTPNKATTPKVGKAVPAKTDKPVSNNKKKKLPPKEVKIIKVYSLRRPYESQNALVDQSETQPKDVEVVNVEEKLDSKEGNITTNTTENKAAKLKKKSDSINSSKSPRIIDEIKEAAPINNTKDHNINDNVEQLKGNTNKCIHEDNDDILNAINELLEDSSTTSSNNMICKPRNSVSDSTYKESTKKITDDVKPDVMYVDILEIEVKEEEPAVTPDVINDSPRKTEKRSTLIGDDLFNDGQPAQIDCNSHFKMETESPTEFIPATPHSKADDCTEMEISASNESNKISPPFKRNEMVSIPENCEMTDDDSNFTTSTENDVDTQDHNSNLTNVSAKTQNNFVDLTQKKMFISSAEMYSVIRQDVSTEKLDLHTEKNGANIEKDNLVNEQHDMSLDEVVDEDVTINEKDLLNESDQSASILQIDNEPNSDVGDKVEDESVELILNDGAKSDFLLETFKSNVQEVNSMNEKDLLNESGQSASILQIDNSIQSNSDVGDKKVDASSDIFLSVGAKSDPLLSGAQEVDSINEKDILYKSGQSASVLKFDNESNSDVGDKVVTYSFLNRVATSDQKQEKVSIEIQQNENILPCNSNESNPFLGDVCNIDVYKDDNVTFKNNYFREVHVSKPPDLTIESMSAKAALLLNVNNNSDVDEDSDDEPSPEYEPLGEEITEEFRQHMKCIESSITDKNDEAQLVKVCNEIAIIEESKAKLTDIKLSMNKISLDASLLHNSLNSSSELYDIKINVNNIIPNASLLNSSSEGDLYQKIVKEERIKIESEEVKSEKLVCIETMKTDLTKTSDDDLTKDNKYEILDGLDIMKKAVENKLKSPSDKKKHRLSLNRSKYEKDTKGCIVYNDNTVNPRYKTIEQIEEIMKNRPKRPPIENGEVRIPEIKENGYHPKETDTNDHYDDDFDIDKASVNSEDSEISLPHEKIPARRSLRTRPKKGGLEDPEFLAYMELRQDDLIEQHPELSIDDIVLYLYKTYAYSQNLESDVVEETALVNSIKQETPSPPKKISKKSTQPKNTIENFFRAKYKNAFDLEKAESSGKSECNEDVKHKRRNHSISPVDSGIGNSKDSNESDTLIFKRRTKAPQIELTKDMKVELINDAKHKDTMSPKTPKQQRKKTISPRVLGSTISKISPKALQMSMDKRVPVVVISPIKEERNKIKLKYESVTRHRCIIQKRHASEVKTEHETVIETKREPNTEIDHEADIETVTEMMPETVTETKHKTLIEAKQKMVKNKKNELVTETKRETVVKTVRETKQEPVTEHESVTETIHEPVIETKQEPLTETKCNKDTETESIDSDSEISLRQLRSKVLRENQLNELKKELLDLKNEMDGKASVSSDNEPLLKLKPKKVDKSIEGSYEDPEFLHYLEIKQEAIMEENPQLSQNEIKAYLYKTWIYEKDSKSDIRKIDDIESTKLVKSLNQESVPPKRAKRKPKAEKNIEFRVDEIVPKDKPRRKTVSHYYNEAFISDIEDELEVFEIFKTKKAPVTVVSKSDSPKKESNIETKSDETLKTEIEDNSEEINTLDEIELYFKQLTSPKPSVFKGLIREKVCEICEDISNLIKCKGCNGTFHYECVTKVVEIIETPPASRGRKKKKKVGRKSRNLEDSDHSDDQDNSAENISIEEAPETITIDADTLESQLEAKMKELLEKETQFNYDSYSSDDGIDWTETQPGKCELVDVKLKKRSPSIDITNFKCNNCQLYNAPVCFVCKSAISKKGVETRQRCNIAHCHSYYHVECLDHWPQTQFNAGELTRSNKKASGQFEALTCPRHVCHSCVSDDPRGCKTRFSGDKLAKCVRCPATYHSFNKCLPAGTQILTASLIICPRHYEHRPGKVPCHVNTGWCFICALGGSLICCEYCPTSFHAECLNIKPPEGNYMCEDCETGRLPLYGEMVWVKLGHYRWWPGVILHPSEIPDNIMAVKHGLGEFVVRFFGQYDHYWVNRGRVFPYQEGDSGRISSQKSKIDVAFTTAMEHAQRAFEILKNAVPDEEESLDIASSLLPPHYVKLKCNKPIGSLLGRKIEDPSLSLTQCECNALEIEPCGPNSQCINRMLLTECGPTCRAGDRCSNRAFEKRLYPKLTPYKAPHRGWGLKTLEDIKAGQFVIEYVGELLDEQEFQMRMARKHEIRDENFYFLALDKERMIDAGPKGNLARFMNHCCEPNCETQKWTVLGDVRVGLFAINDIKANSEVTFNYKLECTGIEKKRCLCGAKRCSGYIGAKPKQLDEPPRKKNGTLTGKRKYTKRKNIEVSPISIKIKIKRPLGRPPKPKELTEIEKDLLIIKGATANSSDESRCQSVEEKNLKPLKTKTDANPTDEGTISSVETECIVKNQSNSREEIILNRLDSVKCKESNIQEESIKEDSKISNVKGPSKTLKRKLDLNITEEVILSTEPCAKRQKCDKLIEVGD